MKILTEQEFNDSPIFGHDYFEKGAYLESTIQELADLDAGTTCAGHGNSCFKTLSTKFPDNRIFSKFEHYHDGRPTLDGMVAIECTDEDQAYEIEVLAESARGSLRNDYDLGNRFWIFEVE